MACLGRFRDDVSAEEEMARRPYIIVGNDDGVNCNRYSVIRRGGNELKRIWRYQEI